MSLLAPLFLIGAAAVVAPIIFHLWRSAPRDRYLFPATRFLTATPPRTERRRRLENPWLLLLRCLALALLALAFSRPYFDREAPESPLEEPEQYTVVLLDRSASMRRETLWTQAIDATREFLNAAPASETISVGLFDETLEWIPDARRVSPTLGASAIAALTLDSLTYRSTRTGEALTRAIDDIAEMRDRGASEGRAFLGKVILVSDFHVGSRIDTIEGSAWPEGVTVETIRVDTARPSDASLFVSGSGSGAGTRTLGFPVRVSNAEASLETRFQLQWFSWPEEESDAPTDVFVAPSGSEMVSLESPPHPAILRLSRDEHPFNNDYFYAPLAPTPCRIGLFTCPTASSPNDSIRPFLEAALASLPNADVELLTNGDAVAAEDALDWILIDDFSDPALVGFALGRIRSGTPGLILLPDLTGAQEFLRRIGSQPTAVREADVSGFSLIGGVEFDHPVFTPFAEPQFSNFSKISFWKYRELAASAIPNAKVLARFDDGTPLLLEAALDAGSVYILTTTWTLNDSQLALSTKFAPLLQAFLQSHGALKSRPSGFVVGDAFAPPEGPGALSPPDAIEVQLESATEPYIFETPGIYKWIDARGEWLFPVNLSRSELRTDPLDISLLQGKGELEPASADPSLSNESQESAVSTDAAITENRQRIWKWLLVATLGVLALETLLGRLLKPIETPEAASL